MSVLFFMAGCVYQGTKYRRKYGPLLYSKDGKAIYRLFQYSLGYGVLAGFPLAFVSSYFNENNDFVVSLILGIIAIPFFSMNMMGAFALGRFLMVM